MAACGSDKPTNPDKLPPFIAWVSPDPAADTLHVFPSDTTTVEFRAGDDGGIISAVTVYVDGSAVDTLTASPFRTLLDLSAVGNNRSVRVFATASDPTGKVGSTEDTLRFVVSLPPDTATWTLLPEVPRPQARSGHSFSADRDNDRAILFGGFSSVTFASLNDAWAFDFATSTWDSLEAPGPPPVRTEHGAGIGNGRLVVFGGEFFQGGVDSVLEDYALLELGTLTWSINLFDLHLRPAWALSSAEAGDVVYLYGGKSSTDGPSNDSLRRFDALTGSWSDITTSGQVPGDRASAGLALDLEENRLFLFGGTFDTLSLPTSASNYRLDLATLNWKSTAAPGPPPLTQTAAAYDSLNHRVLVWGGRDDVGAYPTTLWEFSMGALRWRQVPTKGPMPAGRAGHRAVVDPARDRIIIFGGSVSGLGVDETWELRW